MTSIDTRLPVNSQQLIDPTTLKTKKDTSGDFEKMKAHWNSQTAAPAPATSLMFTPETDTARNAGAKTKVDAQIIGQFDSDSAVAQFLEYMSKTPEERWHEQWLKSKGLTEEEFAALSPEEQQALMDEMTEDLKRQALEKAAEKSEEALL